MKFTFETRRLGQKAKALLAIATLQVAGLRG